MKWQSELYLATNISVELLSLNNEPMLHKRFIHKVVVWDKKKKKTFHSSLSLSNLGEKSTRLGLKSSSISILRVGGIYKWCIFLSPHQSPARESSEGKVFFMQHVVDMSFVIVVWILKFLIFTEIIRNYTFKKHIYERAVGVWWCIDLACSRIKGTSS